MVDEKRRVAGRSDQRGQDGCAGVCLVASLIAHMLTSQKVTHCASPNSSSAKPSSKASAFTTPPTPSAPPATAPPAPSARSASVTLQAPSTRSLARACSSPQEPGRPESTRRSSPNRASGSQSPRSRAIAWWSRVRGGRKSTKGKDAMRCLVRRMMGLARRSSRG